METKPCPSCNGRGFYDRDDQSPVTDSRGNLIRPGVKVKVKCNSCGGRGRIPKN